MSDEYTPTPRLRYVKRELLVPTHVPGVEKRTVLLILQQAWVSPHEGYADEWRDVPLEEE